MPEYFEDWKLTRVKAATVAGTTDTLVSSSVDMNGYDGVLFFTTFGTITATAVTTWKAQTSSDNSSFNDLAGTGISVADDDDGQTFGTQIVRPLERYLRAAIVRATANAVVGEIYALQFGAGIRPKTNTVTDTATFESHYSPAEGTA